MQPNNFAILTAAVRFSKDLTDRQKLLYAEITALSNMKGYCYATNNYIGQLYGRSPETISRDISALERYGFVSIKLIRKKEGGTIRYIFPLMESNSRLDEMVKPRLDETVKHNKISINNISHQEAEDIPLKAIKYFIQRVENAYEALPSPETRDNLTAILQKATPAQIKAVIDRKAAQFHRREIDARIFNMKWLFKPVNFFNELSIAERPATLAKEKRPAKVSGQNSGRKIAKADDWQAAEVKHKNGW